MAWAASWRRDWRAQTLLGLLVAGLACACNGLLSIEAAYEAPAQDGAPSAPEAGEPGQPQPPGPGPGPGPSNPMPPESPDALAPDAPGPPVNVAGLWFGTVDDEEHHLDLSQAGTTVAGVSCKAPGVRCHSIREGAVAGDHLTFSYVFTEDAAAHTVTFDLRFDGVRRLWGSARSTKCDCVIPVDLARR